MSTHAPPVHTLRALDARDALAGLGDLCELLMDAVDGGASVGFLAPLGRDRTMAYWQGVADEVSRGRCQLLVACDSQGRIDGTVQLVPAAKENQPHRADICKLLVHRRARRAGLGARLMQAAEGAAREAGRHLLVLDTSTPEAERLYRRLGWQRAGAVPGYALLPDGSPCAATWYYKSLTAPAA